jgi:hypothetical protein
MGGKWLTISSNFLWWHANHWQWVTGVLPPISSISADTSKSNDIPWYSIFNDHISSQNMIPQVLSDVRSATQIEPTKSTADIGPDRACALHSHYPGVCVFRPCSHTACDACLGKALRMGSKCLKCSAAVVSFVGVEEPIPQVVECASTDGGQAAWRITGMEDLERQTVDANNVTIIHLEDDNVSGLKKGGPSCR